MWSFERNNKTSPLGVGGLLVDHDGEARSADEFSNGHHCRRGSVQKCRGEGNGRRGV